MGQCQSVINSVAILLVLVWVSLAHGVDYYFSDCATGGAGTQGDPYCLDPGATGTNESFEFVMNGSAPDVVAGDTIFLCAGACDGTGTTTYHVETTGTNLDAKTYVFDPQVSGTSGQPITITTHPGETVIISGDSNNNGVNDPTDVDVLFTTNTTVGRGKGWYVIQNLTFEKTRSHIMQLREGQDLVIDNVDLRFTDKLWTDMSAFDAGCVEGANPAYALTMRGLTTSYTVRNSRIYHICGFAHRNTSNPNAGSMLFENNEYWNMTTVSNDFVGRNQTWRNNFMHDVNTGLSVEEDMTNITIEDNTIACLGNYIQNADGGCRGAGILIHNGNQGGGGFSTANITIRRNRIYGVTNGIAAGTNHGWWGSGIRFTVTNNVGAINSVIENNMLWKIQSRFESLSSAAIHVASNKSVTVQNNTIYDAKYGLTVDTTAHVLRNNLVVKAFDMRISLNRPEIEITSAAAATTLEHNNMWAAGDGDPVLDVAGTTYNCADTFPGTNNICGVPDFVNIAGGPATWDLHLTPSDMTNRNAATPGPTDDIDQDVRSLTTPDIGADEIIGTSYFMDGNQPDCTDYDPPAPMGGGGGCGAGTYQNFRNPRTASLTIQCGDILEMLPGPPRPGAVSLTNCPTEWTGGPKPAFGTNKVCKSIDGRWDHDTDGPGEREFMEFAQTCTASTPVMVRTFDGGSQGEVILTGRGYDDGDFNDDLDADGVFGQTNEKLIWVTGDHIHIKGPNLRVEYSNRWGIHLNGSFGLVEEVLLENNWGVSAAIQITGGNNTVRYNETRYTRHRTGIELITGSNDNYVHNNLSYRNSWEPLCWDPTVTGYPTQCKVLPISGDPDGGSNTDAFGVDRNCHVGQPAGTNACQRNEFADNAGWWNTDGGFDTNDANGIKIGNVMIRNGFSGVGQVEYKMLEEIHVGDVILIGNVAYCGFERGWEHRLDAAVANPLYFYNNTGINNDLSGAGGAHGVVADNPSMMRFRNNLLMEHDAGPSNNDINVAPGVLQDHAANWAANDRVPGYANSGNPQLVNTQLFQQTPGDCDSIVVTIPLPQWPIQARNQWVLDQARAAFQPDTGSGLIDAGATWSVINPRTGQTITSASWCGKDPCDIGAFQLAVPSTATSRISNAVCRNCTLR